jgi:signal transduction histidine kinase
VESTPNGFKLTDRISFHQAKTTMLIAIVLGTLFSVFQISWDYFEQTENLESTVNQILNIMELSASQAAYSLDREYASELIGGLFEYSPIYEASITDDLGNILAKIQGGRDTGWLQPLTDRIFGAFRVFQIPLRILPPPVRFVEMGKLIKVGELNVTVDTYPIGLAFLKRSLFVFMSGMIRNLALALILLIFFHYFLTKPFLGLEQSLLKTNPRHPERIRLRIPKGHEKDEFARMVVATNRLLTTIQQNIKERIRHIAETERFQGELAERKRRENELEAIKSQLESTNRELTTAITNLKTTQSRLIQTERMAALGEVTASMAHEINTPLGLGVSGASHLTDEFQKFRSIYKDRAIDKSEFEEFLDVGIEITELITYNLRKSHRLIKSFKQVAVDQISEAKRTFRVKAYTEQVLLSMGNIISKSGHSISVECDEKLEIEGYPGAFSQVLTNLVLNSIAHGFDQGQKGEIKLTFSQTDGRVQFTFKDNGKGIPREIQEKIYEPFFTTKPYDGGTGLGLHIVYNIVTNQFRGKIDCFSGPGEGTKFVIDLLKSIPT